MRPHHHHRSIIAFSFSSHFATCQAQANNTIPNHRNRPPTMSTTMSIPQTSRSTRRGRRDRQRTPSSLAGMMLGSSSEETSSSSLLDESSTSKYSHQERQELQEMTLKLRRAKRRLLLKSAEQPSSNVDRLREILLQLSLDTSEDDEESMGRSRSRSSSISSMV